MVGKKIARGRKCKKYKKERGNKEGEKKQRRSQGKKKGRKKGRTTQNLRRPRQFIAADGGVATRGS